MDEKDGINKVPPPNPPPAGDSEEPTPNPSQDFGVSAQSNEGNKSEIGNRKSETGREKGERLYIREGHQNLLRVLELLDKKFPVPVSHRQIQDTLELSKSVVFDICWNLCFRGWAEDMGAGRVRRRFDTSDNDARLGREVKKLGELECGVILNKNSEK